MADLADWQGCPAPSFAPRQGNYICIAPYDSGRDLEALFSALCGADNDDLWRYIPIGPFDDAQSLAVALDQASQKAGWHTLIFRQPHSDTVLGMASYMRIRPEHGSAEVGCVVFSPALQRTPAATEAMFMMATHLFDDLGYRRYEWKCNNRNQASRRAAERFGFAFEGVFRNDMVVKGENRDTAWFSMTDDEWPAIKRGFEVWLSANNFDADGQQKRSLSACCAGDG